MNGSESAINRCGRRGIPCARIGHLPASIETATAEIKSRLLMIESVCHRSREQVSSRIPPLLEKDGELTTAQARNPQDA